MTMPEAFTVTKNELKNCPPMTHRERFVYICTSLVLNPVVQNLTQERRDEILQHMRKEICPEVTNADWYVIFHELEKNRDQLMTELQTILTPEEMQNIAGKFMSLLSSTDIQKLGGIAADIQNKLQQK